MFEPPFTSFFSKNQKAEEKKSVRTIGLIITFFITGISTADFVGGQKPWAVLKVDSFEGYLPENAEVGTTVRIAPSMKSASLQILVDDQDLKPGMPPAIYQYILTGYGAEKFAVDQRGFLFLNSNNDIDADRSSSTFMLHVLAREVDTTPCVAVTRSP
uniref:Uncharacterized protein n=1 Tax=Ditylenchus dipsaci TaxID=166011 RepID=A0A915D2U8_9BILA